MPDSNSVRTRSPHLGGFLWHLIAYFVVMAVLVAINLLTTPGRPWFIWPLVAWMAPLAIHAAYAMHLFGKPRE